jgi:hypothetical protein
MGDHDWGDQLLVALGDFARYLHINEVFLISTQFEIDIRLSTYDLCCLEKQHKQHLRSTLHTLAL